MKTAQPAYPAQPDLLGRDREIAAVDAMLAAAVGHAGSAVVVSAGAGTGKTALLGVAVDRARRAGFTVLTARGIPSERDLPFGLVRRLFEPVVPEPADAVTEPGKRPFTEPGTAPGTRPGTAPGTAPGKEPGTDPVADSGPQVAELQALHRALAELAAQGPVLVAVDDLQWLDRPSLAWLSALPQRIDHARVAVLLTLCPGEACTDPAALDELLAASATELHPADLGPAEAAALLERTLPTAPDRAFAAAVMAETGGNPLAVTELAAAVRDAAVRPTADAAALLGDLAVPRLTATTHARLRRISPHALSLARAVAVLGAEPDLTRVARVCGVEPPVAAEVAAALSQAGLVRTPKGSADSGDRAGDRAMGPAVAFAHPVTRAAVLSRVPYPDLQALHARAARVLRATGAPDGRVTEQLAATTVLGEPWAADLLREAAGAALGRGEPGPAAALLRRALHEPAPDPVRTTTLAELGRAEAYTDLGAAIRDLTAASRGHADERDEPAERDESAERDEPGERDEPDATDPLDRTDLHDPAGARAAVVRDLADLLALTGRHRAAVEALERTAAPDRALWAAELGFDGEAVPDLDLLARVPKPAVKGGADDGRYLSLLAMRTAWAGRSRSRAVALAEQALAVLPVTPQTVRPVLRAVLVLAQAGRTEDAYERCDALVARTERWGHRPCLAAARSLRAVVAHRLGRLPAAARDARAALDLLTECGAPQGRGAAVEFLARLVEILVDLGDHDEAACLVERADLAGELPVTWAATALLLARGRLRAAAGAPAEGLRDLLAAGGRLGTWTADRPAVADWRSDAAAALLALGERAEARRHAADAVAQARQWGAPGPLGAALRTLGAVTGGAEGLARLEQSVSLLERSPARLESARSLAEYGAALGRAKRWAPARRALRAALDLAEECGCPELARRSRVTLSASGGRPPRSAGARGVAALTAAELRTATLAAEGRTNRELADLLLVRLRTVEVHLTHAYRKLGIDGREQLAAALHGGAGRPLDRTPGPAPERTPDRSGS